MVHFGDLMVIDWLKFEGIFCYGDSVKGDIVVWLRSIGITRWFNLGGGGGGVKNGSLELDLVNCSIILWVSGNLIDFVLRSLVVLGVYVGEDRWYMVYMPSLD